MDVLSELLTLLKPRSYITAGFDAGGNWALTLDDLAGRIKCYAVMSGECWLTMDGIGDAIKVSAGDCFVLPSGRSVHIASDLQTKPRPASEVLDPNRSGEIVTYNGGGDVLLVGSRFEIDGCHAEFMLKDLPPIIRVDTSSDKAKLRFYLDLMMAELKEMKPGAMSVAQNLSHMILAQALRLHLQTANEMEVGWFAALSDPRIGKALEAMHSEPSRTWTLEVLADKVGMSRSSFAAHFRRRVGETPMSYLTRWRMVCAAERLSLGREAIAQISRSLGYASEHAFNTAFKRVMGAPPRQYGRRREQVSLT
ncbi:AraC family transcriptional regulator [Rhizobium sp. CECT 9324]|jgi:AraC-like DNA-binding protein|uniref:AraC family transcriptional regulator n=1 Tax=Rhizobium sp. CECT 9324 TaxID=2845820 RepID=UPI001E4C761F|nr:AraC family transcriptional regulator [Rhizobium sp. CECT 9324]CAH0343576.1 IS5 family transposase IS4811 [Rhizobium sp. CECT 9324]